MERGRANREEGGDDKMDGLKEGRSVSLTRRMSKVGLLAAMKTFTRPHFQRKKKTKAEMHNFVNT